MLSELTIVSITYNNESELKNTLSSIECLTQNGANVIVVNGGNPLKLDLNEKFLLLQEPDNGLFDAIDKGIKKVTTKYFILIHSGDSYISNEIVMNDIINRMDNENFDFSLGSQLIPFNGLMRIHSSRYWKPIFYMFGSMAPHLPTVYRFDYVENMSYSKYASGIADFQYQKELFTKNPKWYKHNQLIIKMEPGGCTTSGLKSFFYVSKKYIECFGLIKGITMIIFRIPIKLIQTIK